MALYDQEGLSTRAQINSTSVNRDTIGHLTFTSPGPARYYLRVSGGVPPDRYQFVITPPAC